MPTHRFPLPRRSRLARLYSTAATLTVSSALLLGPGATLARADRPAPPQKTDPARAVLGTEQTAYGTVRVKSTTNGSFAPEFDDCRRLAKEKRVPLRLVIAEANHAFRQRTHS